VIGIPLYGKSFTLSNPSSNGINAYTNGPGLAGSFYPDKEGFLGYNEICTNIINNGWAREWQSVQKVPYAYKGDQWVGYDDIESVFSKIMYININNLGGAAMLSIEYSDINNICGNGDFTLLRLVYNQIYASVRKL
jgi:chitinase